MHYDEFLVQVRTRGEYRTLEESQRVLQAVLALLGMQLSGAQSQDLGSQLPEELADMLAVPTDNSASSVTVDDFLHQLAIELGTNSPHLARWDARAVLITVADAISVDTRAQLLSRLPHDYPILFGRSGERREPAD